MKVNTLMLQEDRNNAPFVPPNPQRKAHMRMQIKNPRAPGTQLPARSRALDVKTLRWMFALTMMSQCP